MDSRRKSFVDASAQTSDRRRVERGHVGVAGSLPGNPRRRPHRLPPDLAESLPSRDERGRARPRLVHVISSFDRRGGEPARPPPAAADRRPPVKAARQAGSSRQQPTSHTPSLRRCLPTPASTPLLARPMGD